MAKGYFDYKKYGMRSADYALMLSDQDGVCAICHKKSDKRLVIDHDHDSLEVRGLLCNSCNLAIGLLKDNPEACHAAAEYLEDGGNVSRFRVEGGRLLTSYKD